MKYPHPHLSILKPEWPKMIVSAAMVFVGDLGANSSAQRLFTSYQKLILEAISQIRGVHMSTKDLIVSKDTPTVTNKVGETRPGY